jgi:hypothetical protein
MCVSGSVWYSSFDLMILLPTGDATTEFQIGKLTTFLGDGMLKLDLRILSSSQISLLAGWEFQTQYA